MLAFQIARQHAAELDIAMRERSAQLNEVVARLSGGVRGPMNLVPDHVKANPEFVAARAAFDRAFQRLRAFNAVYVRDFKREIAEDRRAARKAA